MCIYSDASAAPAYSSADPHPLRLRASYFLNFFFSLPLRKLVNREAFAGVMKKKKTRERPTASRQPLGCRASYKYLFFFLFFFLIFFCKAYVSIRQHTSAPAYSLPTRNRSAAAPFYFCFYFIFIYLLFIFLRHLHSRCRTATARRSRHFMFVFYVIFNYILFLFFCGTSIVVADPQPLGGRAIEAHQAAARAVLRWHLLRTSASVSIRQHTSALKRLRQRHVWCFAGTSCIRQHTSASVSIRQH
jgi:hypothetical protein